ncbi:MAG: hypothetical protein GX049_12710 [Alcaligenaceae bacterium]|nr:hypothetical protein [Alcaligenaceae bacterium]
MRLFNLFLRRAGVQSTRSVSAASLPDRSVSRLTVECPRTVLPELRRQICLDFEAAGLELEALRIDSAQNLDMARACLTIRYTPANRRALMSQARQISEFPGVQRVQWGDRAGKALN